MPERERCGPYCTDAVHTWVVSIVIQTSKTCSWSWFTFFWRDPKVSWSSIKDNSKFLTRGSDCDWTKVLSIIVVIKRSHLNVTWLRSDCTILFVQTISTSWVTISLDFGEGNPKFNLDSDWSNDRVTYKTGSASAQAATEARIDFIFLVSKILSV